MITNDRARTRALYDWERYDLCKRKGVHPVSLEMANRMAIHLCGWVAPLIDLRDIKHVPYYDGNKIILTKNDHDNLTLVHELAHFITYHSKGHHSKSFVVEYIHLMVLWFSWAEEELTTQAYMRGLL